MKTPVKQRKPPQKRMIPPEHIAVYGHVAALLRELMFARDLDAGDLNQALGKPRGHATVYQWLACRSGPGPEMREKLAKILAVPAERFEKRPLATAEKPAGKAVVKAGPPALLAPRVPASSPALAFTVSEDGTSRLRLDVTLPAQQGVTLLRLLLDAGMVAASPA